MQKFIILSCMVLSASCMVLHPQPVPHSLGHFSDTQSYQSIPNLNQLSTQSYSQQNAQNYNQQNAQSFNQQNAQTYNQQNAQYNQQNAQSYNQQNAQSYNQQNAQAYNQQNAQSNNQQNARNNNQHNAQSSNQQNSQGYSQQNSPSYNQQNALAYSQQNSYNQHSSPSFNQATEQHHTPNYNFAYEVNDVHTGDIKNQQESRLGDSVLGQYSLLQPDGVRRTVDYRADEHAGFRATVNNEGRRNHERQNLHAPSHQTVAVTPVTVSPAYLWPTVSVSPTPAVAVSRSSIVQTFTHNANPWF